MKYATRILIPVLASMALLPGTVPPAISVAELSPLALPSPQVVDVGEPAVDTDQPSTNTTVTGGTEQQRALVVWALEQYETAGLDLPVLQFHLALDISTCNGNSGLFSPSSTPWRITLCTDERMVFLHEIGHAWAEHKLTDSDRAVYVDQRGLKSWNDPETPWSARGSEDAANTLAWGLIDDPIRGMSPNGPLASKNLAFRLLTGVDSPRITE